MWLMSKSPDAASDGLVLLDDRRVLNGHQPAAELDEPSPVTSVPLEKGRLQWAASVAIVENSSPGIAPAWSRARL